MYREAPPEPVGADPANGFRISAGFGGLLLFFAFFLPAMRECGSDFVPREALVRSSWPELLFGIPLFAFPYFAPLLLGIGALARMRSRDHGVRIGWIVHWAFFVVVVGAGVMLGYHAATQRAAWSGFGFVFALLLAVFLARSRRVGARGHFRGGIALSCMLLAWFGFLLVASGNYARHGLYVSFGGAAALTVGTVGERRASR